MVQICSRLSIVGGIAIDGKETNTEPFSIRYYFASNLVEIAIILVNYNETCILSKSTGFHSPSEKFICEFHKLSLNSIHAEKKKCC